ncbi:MAG: NAD(P)-binding domain-containing protein [Acidobacteriales bacterium]|nr:NAD(P)-binding domain-containing protein [Terriglobales bacterium]
MSKRKPSIAIVGAGRVGRVLALCLRKAGYRVTAIVARDEAGSRGRAAKVARAVGAEVITTGEAAGAADVFWVCVGDDAITGGASGGDQRSEPGTVADPARDAGQPRKERRGGCVRRTDPQGGPGDHPHTSGGVTQNAFGARHLPRAGEKCGGALAGQRPGGGAGVVETCRPLKRARLVSWDDWRAAEAALFFGKPTVRATMRRDGVV